MAAVASAFAESKLAEGDVEIIVYNKQVSRLHAKSLRRIFDGYAAVVHESSRLDQDDILAGMSHLREIILAFPWIERLPGISREEIDNHEPDVVPRGFIFGSNVPEPDYHLRAQSTGSLENIIMSRRE